MWEVANAFKSGFKVFSCAVSLSAVSVARDVLSEAMVSVTSVGLVFMVVLSSKYSVGWVGSVVEGTLAKICLPSGDHERVAVSKFTTVSSAICVVLFCRVRRDLLAKSNTYIPFARAD